MVRAVAYIRVSTDRQARDGTSLVTQRRRVHEYAASKRYELVRQFVEEGESAKTDKRPVLQEMLRYCKEQRGKIDVLIFPKIDRFARYSADYHYLKGYLKEQGIRVESTDEQFDDSPSGRFLESLLAATAQFDNDVRSERAFNGMREAVAEGRWVWGAPRGYRNASPCGKATIEPDPAVAPIIVCAFEQAASMAPIKEILDWLRLQGISMSRSSFHRMLHNKAYIGIIEAFGASQSAAPPFLPLVPEGLFRRAQNAIRRRQAPKVYERDNRAFPLRGTLRCPCGKFLTASWARGRSARYPYYRCRRCSRVNLRGEFVEEQFVRTLALLRGRFSFDQRMVARLKASWDKDTSVGSTRAARVQREVSKLESFQRTLTLKVAEGVVPDHLAKEQFLEIEAKLVDLRAELRPIGDPQVSFEQLIGHGRSFFRQIDQLWLHSDVSVRKRLQRVLFPSGATLEFAHGCRTAKSGPLAGSAASSSAQLSRAAAPAGGSANRQEHKTITLLANVVPERPHEFIEFLRRVYFELGDIAAPTVGPGAESASRSDSFAG